MKVLKKGAPVRLIQPVIQGLVVGGKLAESGDEIDYVVAVKINGEVIERHFPSESLEVVTDTADVAIINSAHDEYLDAVKENSAQEAVFAAQHGKESK